MLDELGAKTHPHQHQPVTVPEGRPAALTESQAATDFSSLHQLSNWTIASRDLTTVGQPGAQSVVAWASQAAQLGANRLLLGSVREASPELDHGELSEVRAEARRLGIAIEVCFGPVHPVHMSQEEAKILLGAGNELGTSTYHVVFGTLEDRFSARPAWRQVLDDAPSHLRQIFDQMTATPVFRTHEEMTTFELLRVVDAVGGQPIGIGFSPVNVVVRAEDPWEAFRRVEPLVKAVFLDDTRLARTTAGLGRRLCRFGEGVVPWQRVFGALENRPEVNYIVDIHRAEFDLPVFDEDWLADQPDLTVRELAKIFQAASDDAAQEPPDLRAEWLKSRLSRVVADQRATPRAPVGADSAEREQEHNSTTITGAIK